MTNLALVVVGWCLGWWAFGRQLPVDRIGPGRQRTSGTPGARVSVVVPARNEAVSLPLLLADLAVGRPEGAEVVVVDDHSTDGTAELAAGFDFVRVVAAPPLPPGWTGKSWACATGVAAATGDVLVLLDADVRVDPGALDRVLAERDRLGGLVSVQPWHTAVRRYERLSALFNVVALMGVGSGSRRPCRGAFGPVLVTSRHDYDTAGGHRTVRSEVVEDLALASAYRAAGLPVAVRTGERSIRFRMYPDGVRSLVQGWTKNFVSGAGSTAPLRLGAIVVWITSLGATVGVAADALSNDLPWWAAPLVYVGFVAQLRFMFRRTGDFGTRTAIWYPALMAVFVVVFARSTWRTYVRRSVVWRGRSVPVGAGRH